MRIVRRRRNLRPKVKEVRIRSAKLSALEKLKADSDIEEGESPMESSSIADSRFAETTSESDEHASAEFLSSINSVYRKSSCTRILRRPRAASQRGHSWQPEHEKNTEPIVDELELLTPKNGHWKMRSTPSRRARHGRGYKAQTRGQARSEDVSLHSSDTGDNRKSDEKGADSQKAKQGQVLRSTREEPRLTEREEKTAGKPGFVTSGSVKEQMRDDFEKLFKKSQIKKPDDNNKKSQRSKPNDNNKESMASNDGRLRIRSGKGASNTLNDGMRVGNGRVLRSRASNRLSDKSTAKVYPELDTSGSCTEDESSGSESKGNVPATKNNSKPTRQNGGDLNAGNAKKKSVIAPLKDKEEARKTAEPEGTDLSGPKTKTRGVMKGNLSHAAAEKSSAKAVTSVLKRTIAERRERPLADNASETGRSADSETAVQAASMCKPTQSPTTGENHAIMLDDLKDKDDTARNSSSSGNVGETGLGRTLDHHASEPVELPITQHVVKSDDEEAFNDSLSESSSFEQPSGIFDTIDLDSDSSQSEDVSAKSADSTKRVSPQLEMSAKNGALPATVSRNNSNTDNKARIQSTERSKGNENNRNDGNVQGATETRTSLTMSRVDGNHGTNTTDPPTDRNKATALQKSVPQAEWERNQLASLSSKQTEKPGSDIPNPRVLVKLKTPNNNLAEGVPVTTESIVDKSEDVTSDSAGVEGSSVDGTVCEDRQKQQARKVTWDSVLESSEDVTLDGTEDQEENQKRPNTNSDGMEPSAQVRVPADREENQKQPNTNNDGMNPPASVGVPMGKIASNHQQTSRSGLAATSKGKKLPKKEKQTVLEVFYQIRRSATGEMIRKRGRMPLSPRLFTKTGRKAILLGMRGRWFKPVKKRGRPTGKKSEPARKEGREPSDTAEEMTSRDPSDKDSINFRKTEALSQIEELRREFCKKTPDEKVREKKLAPSKVNSQVSSESKRVSIGASIKANAKDGGNRVRVGKPAKKKPVGKLSDFERRQQAIARKLQEVAGPRVKKKLIFESEETMRGTVGSFQKNLSQEQQPNRQQKRSEMRTVLNPSEGNRELFGPKLPVSSQKDSGVEDAQKLQKAKSAANHPSPVARTNVPRDPAKILPRVNPRAGHRAVPLKANDREHGRNQIVRELQPEEKGDRPDQDMGKQGRILMSPLTPKKSQSVSEAISKLHKQSRAKASLMGKRKVISNESPAEGGVRSSSLKPNGTYRDIERREPLAGSGKLSSSEATKPTDVAKMRISENIEAANLKPDSKGTSSSVGFDQAPAVPGTYNNSSKNNSDELLRSLGTDGKQPQEIKQLEMLPVVVASEEVNLQFEVEATNGGLIPMGPEQALQPSQSKDDSNSFLYDDFLNFLDDEIPPFDLAPLENDAETLDVSNSQSADNLRQHPGLPAEKESAPPLNNEERRNNLETAIQKDPFELPQPARLQANMNMVTKRATSDSAHDVARKESRMEENEWSRQLGQARENEYRQENRDSDKLGSNHGTRKRSADVAIDFEEEDAEKTRPKKIGNSNLASGVRSLKAKNGTAHVHENGQSAGSDVQPKEKSGLGTRDIVGMGETTSGTHGSPPDETNARSSIGTSFGSQSNGEKQSVAVIGAGISGLTAAYHLQKSGLYNVTVLEARKTPGGRVKTVGINGKAFELGGFAGLPAGQSADLLQQFCEEHNLKRVKRFVSSVLFDENGEIGKNAKRSGQRWFESLHAKYKIMQEKLETSNGDSTLKPVLEEFLESPLLPSKEKSILVWFITMMEALAGAEAGAISNRYWDWALQQLDYATCNQAVELGCGVVIDTLSKDLAIRYGVAVSEIRYGEAESNVQIVTRGHGVMTADKCIVTVPIPVLKENGLKFTPNLPPSKLKALSNIGTCTFNKILLGFENKFWPDNLKHFAFVPGPRSGDTSSRYRFYLFENVGYEDSKHWLGASTMGEEAELLEKSSDAQLCYAAQNRLKAIFPKADVPLPELKTVRWKSDEFSRGSVPYLVPQGSPQDFVEMGQPVNKRLFFAGDGTTADKPGSVRGAFVSGVREARRILLGDSNANANPPKRTVIV